MKKFKKIESKKLFSILMAVVMILQVFVITPTYAADTREKISNIVATSNTDSIPVYGGTYKRPTFTVTAGDPAYFASGVWLKKEGETWRQYGVNTFTEGTYRYQVQIRIDGEAGTTHVIDSNGITATVDENKWAENSIPSVADTYSYAWAYSKEYVITAPVGIPLNFVKNNSWNIGLNYVGRAIKSFSVSNGAEGGEKPYTFSKVSGPDWISVGSDGTVSGTPTSVGKNPDLVIRVTDKASVTKDITLTVANTVPGPSDRIKINNIVATSDTDSIPVYGGTYKRPTFTVTAGDPAYFASGVWLKKEGETWKQYEGKTFTEGTYRYQVQIRIDGEAGTTHVIDSNGITATVDENKWAENSIPSVADTYSYAWAYSKEYVITETSTETAIEIPKANTNLTYTGNPQTGVNEGPGYTLTNNTATNAGNYTAKATLKAGYKWSDGSTEVKNIPFQIKKADPAYTVPTGLKGQKDAKLSTVTLPKGFTWVDGDVTLSSVGENTFKAKFTPDDTNNYKVVEVDVKVTVEEVTPPAPTVTAIAVNSTTHKTAYKVGDELDVTNLTIEVTKSDGSTQTVNVEKSMVTGFDSSAANPSQELTITYEGKTATYTIKIEEVTPPTPTVTSIAVNSTTHKTAYKVGEDLDVTNLTIEVTKSDGSKETVNVEKSMVTGFDSSAANPSQVLTITYEGKTATYTIKIEEVTPSTTYTVSFDANGGGGAMNSVIVNAGDTYKLPACTFTPPVGKEFKAWEVTGVEKTVGTDITINADTVLKAIWKDKSVTPPTPPTPPTPSTPDVMPLPFGPGYNPLWMIYFRPVGQVESKHITRVTTKVTLTIDSKIMEKSVNGIEEKITMDVAPFIIVGRTMLPIRFVAEALGFNVQWINEIRTVLLTDKDNVITIPVDTNKIVVNGKVYESDVKPLIKTGRTMLPIANVARALGLKDGTEILWDEVSRKVTIIREQVIENR